MAALAGVSVGSILGQTVFDQDEAGDATNVSCIIRTEAGGVPVIPALRLRLLDRNMELNATKPWTVVIAGLWNRGILSPNWIAKYLFGLPEGAEIEVDVPFNTVLPLKVRHRDLTVESQANRLQIECAPDFEALAEAMKIGGRAITELPKTPFSAVGFNVLYEITDGGRDRSAIGLDGVIDRRLQEDDREVTARSAHRKYRWRDGQVLVAVEEAGEQSMRLAINIERQSRSDEDLKAWLQLPVADVAEEIQRIRGWF